MTGVQSCALPISQGQKDAWESFHSLALAGKVKAAWAAENGLADAVMKMSFGNRTGFRSSGDGVNWYAPCPGIAAELTEDVDLPCAKRIGVTAAEPVVAIGQDSAPIDELLALSEAVLEDVYPTRTAETGAVAPVAWEKGAPAVLGKGIARPRVVIPVFPGTNCEYDSARACLREGMLDRKSVV